jgi:general secretion pathway protein I
VKRGLGRRGFTLIEVVVAVAILAVAMGAIITGTARYADHAGVLREKTVALWVAHNHLTEVGLEPSWPEIGASDGDVEMAGIEWHWEAKVAETPDPRVRRIDITVGPKGRPVAAALSSFVQDKRT